MQTYYVALSPGIGLSPKALPVDWGFMPEQNNGKKSKLSLESKSALKQRAEKRHNGLALSKNGSSGY